MLPKKNRIGKDLIMKVVKQGKNFSTQNAYLKVLIDRQINSAFAFVVSGKVSKKATERNKLKRRARNITAKLLKDIKQNVCAAVFFKKEIIGKKFEEIRDELSALYKKAGMM